MSVDEGQVDEAGPEGIEYGAVTSCMTVTCLLDDGNHVGGHLSLTIPDGRYDSASVLPAMWGLIGSRAVVLVHLAGNSDMWSPSYLTEPQWKGSGETADLNPFYTEQPPVEDLGPTIFQYFGVDPSVCTQEYREGAFTITLTAPVSPREELLGDGGTTTADPARQLITGLEAQAGALAQAVSALTGSEDDANATAEIAMAMETFVQDADSVQQMAGQPGAEHLLDSAAGLYYAAADASSKLAVYQEGPDADSLAELKAAIELANQWASSLAATAG
jgi:hypothetical protein